MRERAAWLEAVDPDGQDDEGRAVMESLLSVYGDLAQWGSADPGEAQTLRARVRRPELVTVLQGQRAQVSLSIFASDGEENALRGRVDRYRQACEHRSALKMLMDDYDEVIVDQFTQEAVEDFDEELRDVADDATPVHRTQIPSWAPRSHWWWWKPDPIKLTMREYRRRIYAGDLEDDESSAPGTADWLRCGDKKCWCFTAPG
ncbi:hypothetical protein AGRA3207_005475 [Actinomadura graeca]|uniref:Uncharacterized protein n=1 Tax=Actinomadura graeca TaxID=2750812 RepID=A0ABX8QZM1_9ACTN|nr:hypothetical protein [Actinomadura graeca]QXJ24200.1 hypothetical protein AGRA3207_005475 [Actinomadura graeca]